MFIRKKRWDDLRAERLRLAILVSSYKMSVGRVMRRDLDTWELFSEKVIEDVKPYGFNYNIFSD